MIRQIYNKEDVHQYWTEKLIEFDVNLFVRVVGRDNLDNLKQKDPKLLKKVRNHMKNSFVFPLFYRASRKKIYSLFGFQPQDSEAKSLSMAFDLFFDQYEFIVSNFHKRLRKEYDTKGYIDGANGHRYYGPISFNGVYNYPVQGLCGDVCVDAANRVFETAIDQNDMDLIPNLNIHDELVFEFPDKKLDTYIEKVVPFMLTYSLPVLKVPMKIEVSIGKNFGKLEPYGEFESDILFSGQDGQYIDEVNGYVPAGI